MILQLIGDLPLFLKGEPELIETATADALARVRFPDDLTWDYLSFSDVEEWWSSVARISSPAMLIGTRPRLLHDRVPLRTNDVIFVATARSFDQTGHTTSASVCDIADPERVQASRSIKVVDDVLMTGRTICAVLETLGLRCERVDVATYLSTDVGARRVVMTCPKATIDSHYLARYEPVREGTAIFMWDLLFGSIAGGSALDRRDLLRPFFGSDMTPLQALRDDLAHLGTRPAPKVTDGSVFSTAPPAGEPLRLTSPSRSDRLIVLEDPPRSTDARVIGASLVEEMFSPSGMEDPYPIYTRMRSVDPIHASAFDSVMLFRYEDCMTTLRHPAFLADDFQVRDRDFPEWRAHPAMTSLGSSMVFRNPPDHTRLRSLVSDTFSPQRMPSLRDSIEQEVERVCRDIRCVLVKGESYDLCELATMLPLAVIASILGLPRSDLSWLRGPVVGMNSLVNLPTTWDDIVTADRWAAELLPYLDEAVASRSRRPADDLISRLAAAIGDSGDDDRLLSHEEVLQTLTLLLVAGVQAPANLFTNAMHALLIHRDHLRAVQQDLAYASLVVEETLRYDAPVQMVGRVARCDMVLGGIDVPRGTEITACVGSANRDFLYFDMPDQFVPTRRRRRAASFGNGFHACLGQSLARLEVSTAIAAIVTSFPTIDLSGAAVRRPNLKIRGFCQLPVAFP